MAGEFERAHSSTNETRVFLKALILFSASDLVESAMLSRSILGKVRAMEVNECAHSISFVINSNFLFEIIYYHLRG
jgi:hypothetical protein